MENQEPNDKTETKWSSLRLPVPTPRAHSVKNANDLQGQEMKSLERWAVLITEKVGTMGFFILIFTWTVIWCGYNILASEVSALHWRAFDPFPAFVAYLLISNVIQLLLMPLIMVGQNLQGRHAEIRAQLDFEINQVAEKEVTVVLRHLEHNTDLMIQLMKHLDCSVSTELAQAIKLEHELAAQISADKHEREGLEKSLQK